MQDPPLADLPEHTRFEVVLARLSYAAGHTDRFHFTRNFVKLDPLPAWWKSVIGFVDGDTVLSINQQKLAKNVDPIARELTNRVRSGAIALDTYYDELRKVLKKELAAAREPPPRKDAAAYDALRRYRTSPRRDLLSGSRGRQFKKDVREARKKLGNGALPDLTRPAGPGGEVEAYLEEAVEFYRAHLRLGVLFYNRMRLRPTQLVVGEPTYQLALAPGEEVQIRQTTETKQRASFTEITDQESERTNTFSSTWSTDLSSSIATNSSFQQSTQIGGGVNGSIPETPINVSAQASGNVSTASTISQESSVKESLQKTASISAKMRSQHKVQIEITNEQSTAFSSTRTLRNPNPLRSLHHTFHKVYRKEQVTLERYGARLCVRLQLADPAGFTRDGFLVQFEVKKADLDLKKVKSGTLTLKAALENIAAENVRIIYFDDNNPIRGESRVRHIMKTLKTLAIWIEFLAKEIQFNPIGAVFTHAEDYYGFAAVESTSTGPRIKRFGPEAFPSNKNAARRFYLVALLEPIQAPNGTWSFKMATRGLLRRIMSGVVVKDRLRIRQEASKALKRIMLALQGLK